jgi:hypothetical protein
MIKDLLENCLLTAVFVILLVDVFPNFPWVNIAVGITAFYFGFKLLVILSLLAAQNQKGK